MKEILCDYNHFYGYTDAERRLTGTINPTAFFTYKENDSSEDRINGYRQINEANKPKGEEDDDIDKKPEVRNHLIGRDQKSFPLVELPVISNEKLTIRTI